ncbi:hypothetical protein K7432_016032 [Basidiobolus ranarum]|uniref:Uncharacterized protein n=1 Tax=Basidiobolus ranarum TaxID=34480 RepID=A0ABR2VMX6_9FUNG
MVTYRRAKHYCHKLFKKVQVFCANRLTFFRVHFLYFFFTIFIFSGLLYIEDSKGRQLPYIDALFFSASAMTLTGLSTYNVSTFSIYQQTLLFILMLLGSQVFVAMGLVQIRRYWFNQKFQEVVMEVRKNSKEAKLTRRKSEIFPYALETVTGIQLSSPVGENQDERVLEMGQYNSPLENMFQQEGVRQRQVNNTSSNIENSADQSPYQWSAEDNEHSQVNDTINTTTGRSIAYAPEVDNQRELARLKRQFLSQQYPERPPGANTNFDNPLERTETAATASSFQLPYKDKMALGGLEYRGLLTLQKILPIYFIGFQLVIGLLIRLWFALSPEMTTNTLTHNGNENPAPINPWWFSFFVTISAFNNVGFSLLDQNMEKQPLH